MSGEPANPDPAKTDPAKTDPARTDPVRARRARIARMVAIGKRVGYTALLVAIVAFFAGLVLHFPKWSVFLTVADLVVACVVLPLPIVFGYGVRAAEREDRGP